MTWKQKNVSWNFIDPLKAVFLFSFLPAAERSKVREDKAEEALSVCRKKQQKLTVEVEEEEKEWGEEEADEDSLLLFWMRTLETPWHRSEWSFLDEEEIKHTWRRTSTIYNIHWRWLLSTCDKDI